MSEQTETKTYRGRSLEELVPRIRAELGDDAVILDRREALEGGMGGFFAKRIVEIDAAPGVPAAAFAEELARLQAEESAGDEPEMPPPPPPAPAHKPVVDERVADMPSMADIFPPPRTPGSGLAAMFDVGREPEPEPPETEMAASSVSPSPPAEPPETEMAASSVSPRAPLVAPGDDEQPLLDTLLARGIPAGLAFEVVEHARDALLPFAAGRPLKALVHEALARRIPVAPLRRGGRVVGFVGPGGAGKTRCVAKLAAAHARAGVQSVTAVSLRAEDGGAELARLLAPLGVPMHAVEDARELMGRLQELRAEGLVLVDTPGVSPRAEAELRALAVDIGHLHADEVHLTVPATMGAASARELVDGATALGAGSLAITHADETDQLGTVVALAVERSIPLSLIARGRSIESGLAPVEATELATALLP